jgi:GTP cyclohydrolase I
MLLVTLASRVLLPTVMRPIIGTIFELMAYAVTLRVLGFSKLERRLVTSLVSRYRE